MEKYSVDMSPYNLFKFKTKNKTMKLHQKLYLLGLTSLLTSAALTYKLFIKELL